MFFLTAWSIYQVQSRGKPLTGALYILELQTWQTGVLLTQKISVDVCTGQSTGCSRETPKYQFVDTFAGRQLGRHDEHTFHGYPTDGACLKICGEESVLRRAKSAGDAGRLNNPFTSEMQYVSNSISEEFVPKTWVQI